MAGLGRSRGGLSSKVHLPVGRPRTRPGAVAADKAYSSRGNRSYLRRRRIKAVIPGGMTRQSTE